MMNKTILLLVLITSSCTSFNQYYDIFINDSTDAKSSLINKMKTSPYASIIVKDKTSSFSITLDSISIKGTIWATSNNEYYLMNSGKVFETAGLNNDFKLSLKKDINKIFNIYCDKYSLEKNYTIEGNIYFSNPATNPMKYISELHAVKIEDIISIFNGTTKQTILIKEDVLIPKIKFDVTNYYWINLERCQTMRSIQHLNPLDDKVSFEVMKYHKQ